MTQPILTPTQTHRVEVLTEFSVERDAQIEKWGVQSHPDGTGTMYRMMAKLARDECDGAAKAGTLTWAHILKEEFYEALAEKNKTKLRAELVQVAAVACAWIEDIDKGVFPTN